MNDIGRRRYNTGIRVRVFGEGNAADFPVGSFGRDNFNEVNEALSAMEAGGVTQSSGVSKQSTSNKASTRGELREHLAPIARTAKAISVDDESIGELFRLSTAKNDQTLLAVARAFLANAVPLKTRFVQYGHSKTFLADLETAIQSFEKAMAEQGDAQNNKVGATALADEGMERLMKAIRRLKAIVPNIYAHNPTKSAEWKSAVHIEKADKKKAPDQPK
jgi:hypothetical protein